MKRSEIDKIIDETIRFAKEHQIYLPKFAFWSLVDWNKADKSYEEIMDNMLGWDVTDFGRNDFSRYGLVAFTFRNGNFSRKKKYPKPYCEKLLTLEDGQELPFHFHKIKLEDTINRGGGNLQITVYNSTPNEEIDYKSEVSLTRDGHRITVPAGTTVTLTPGESVTMTQRIYHRWRVEPGTGKVLTWEVSSTNDDNIDNRFLEDVPRLPQVDEDEPIRHVLFADYTHLILE